jgi:glycosyltransferase involved in cell wall biosynthesis
MTRPTISVITVTLNCARLLPGLVESLLKQDDKDFEWVVADGGSSDQTLDVIGRFPTGRTVIVSGPDFGIYHALNKAVAAAHGDYYLVLGADDRIHSNAISSFRRVASETQWDIIAATVETGTTVLRPMRGRRWLRGGNAFVAGHAVGTLIRRQLHAVCGYYSNRYVNGADMFFVLSAASKAQAKIGAADFVAGTFGADGVSTVDHLCSISDAFRIQIAFGENRVVQLLLYGFRLIRALFGPGVRAS